MFRKFKDVLTPAEVDRLRTILHTARFEDGAATAGTGARQVKRNLQAAGREPDLEGARRVVTEALLRHEGFRIHALPLRTLPAIFSRYEPGMTYGDHTDNAIMGRETLVRTDISVTLFLSAPEEYEGGALTIDTDGEPEAVKLPAGSAVVYDATSLHRVEPVMRGQRLAAVTWVQSIIRDAAQRALLADISTTLRFLRASAPNAPETLLLAKSRANLMRMWSEL